MNRSKANRDVGIQRSSRPIPRLHLAFAALQLALALLAVALGVFRACGSCEVGGPRLGTVSFHLVIALAGAGAYLALLLFGWRGRHGVFYFGVLAAAGVHTAFAVWMMVASLLCVPCIASAATALIFAILAIASRSARDCVPPRVLIERAYVPTLLVAGTLAFFAISREGAARADRDRRSRDLARGISAESAADGFRVRAATSGLRPSTAEAAGGESLIDPLLVVAVEQADCPYCLEFRRRYLPRLERDFGSRIEVAFVDVQEARWVKRTPTIAIEDGPVYEGLPLEYEDFRKSVSQALATRNR